MCTAVELMKATSVRVSTDRDVMEHSTWDGCQLRLLKSQQLRLGLINFPPQTGDQLLTHQHLRNKKRQEKWKMRCSRRQQRSAFITVPFTASMQILLILHLNLKFSWISLPKTFIKTLTLFGFLMMAVCDGMHMACHFPYAPQNMRKHIIVDQMFSRRHVRPPADRLDIIQWYSEGQSHTVPFFRHFTSTPTNLPAVPTHTHPLYSPGLTHLMTLIPVCQTGKPSRIRRGREPEALS